MIEQGWLRMATARVATRSGLAQPRTYTDIVDESGNSQWTCSVLTPADGDDADNSHWVCSALEVSGYWRREGQLALGLLSLEFLQMSTTRVATRIGLAQLGSDLLGFDGNVPPRSPGDDASFPYVTTAVRGFGNSIGVLHASVIHRPAFVGSQGSRREQLPG